MTQTNSTIIFANEAATVAFAAKFAARLTPGMIIALYGDLGAGKTAFARALIRTCAGDKNLAVPSPTFTLVQNYDTPRGAIWHYDLYRLAQPDDIYELGWDESLQNIILIEWPERLQQLLPRRRWDLQFDYGAAPDERHLIITEPLP